MASCPALVAMVASRVRAEERLLIECLERRHVLWVQLDERRLVFDLAAAGSTYSVVINRTISQTRRLHISRLLEAQGTPVVNGSAVIATCDDKVATTLALRRRGVPTPRTLVAFSAEGGLEAVGRAGYPAVIKPVAGSWGRLLAKLNDRDAAEAVLEHKEALGSPQHAVVYVQEFVEKPGRDIRVIVIGDAAVAAMYRVSNHWVTNTARRADVRPCPLTPELDELSLQASRAVGGGAIAVDLLETAGGDLLVNEVNSAMEFRGIVEATGVDVAEHLVDHALQVAMQ
jgi:[lysine-biosynthesis-protein LysW]---L-2-aminoadipate ligase